MNSIAPWIAARELLASPERTERSAGGLALILCAVVAAVPYGAVIGSWTSRELALYTAIKFPVLIVGTFLLTFPFGWSAAKLFGLSLSFEEAVRLTTAPLAAATLLLAALTPPALLFTTQIEPPSPSQQSTHNFLYLLHTGSVAIAALFGSRELWRGLAEKAPSTGAAAKTYAVWMVSYAVVAGEVAWILRPFVGSVHMPVEFLRADALDGSVYEFIVTDIVPHFLGR